MLRYSQHYGSIFRRSRIKNLNSRNLNTLATTPATTKTVSTLLPVHRHGNNNNNNNNSTKFTTLKRYKCSLNNNITPLNNTGGFDLTFLGTSSQGGARRYPSCLALRIRGNHSSQVWLFDAGEGATAQLQRSNMRMGLVKNIFITHMHGDHLFGLPGLVMCILGRRDNNRILPLDLYPLHIYGPQGIRAFLRTALGVSSFRIPHQNALYIHELVWPYGCGPNSQRVRHRKAKMYWNKNVKPLSFEGEGRTIEPQRSSQGEWTYNLIDDSDSHVHINNSKSNTNRNTNSTDNSNYKNNNNTTNNNNIINNNNFIPHIDMPAKVVAAPVLHTIPTFAYAIRESVSPRRFDKGKLNELGIPKDGRDEVRKLFTSWLNGERGTWKGKEIDIKQVIQNGRKARTLCVVGDTYDATPAMHIAKNVDVLIHEATNMGAQSEMAKKRGHSSTIGATNFAKKVDAKRLILNHTSVAYSERKIQALENEARQSFGGDDVFVAKDLSVFSVPTEEEDDGEFIFRRFRGFANSFEYHQLYQKQIHSHNHNLNQGHNRNDSRNESFLQNNEFTIGGEHVDDDDEDEDEDEDDKSEGDIAEIEDDIDDHEDAEEGEEEEDDDVDSNSEGRESQKSAGGWSKSKDHDRKRESTHLT